MEITIDNISVKSNPRTDFGDIDELAASIKEKGIIEPLVVVDVGEGKYELVAGERRLRAAKSVGLGTVPVSVYAGNETDVEEVKLIENIQRKDFNAIEEGEAFQTYMSKTGASVETLARKISKPKIYVERRLALLGLCDKAKKALSDGKILLGHALLIARFKTDKEQFSLLKDILREKMSVSEAERDLQCDESTVRLETAKFDKTDCSGCLRNGGEQAVLFESGSELKSVCFDKKCFLKKQADHHKGEVKKLQDQGVKVMPYDDVMKLKTREKVFSWDDDYKKVLKKLPKEPENYVVTFEHRYSGSYDKTVWCINPKARHPKKTPQESKLKSANADDRLKNRASEHKTAFLIGKTQELLKPSTKETKALALFALMKEGLNWNDNDRRDAISKIIETEKIGKKDFGYWGPRFSKILAIPEPDIERITASVAGSWAKNLGDELETGASAFGVSLQDHFVVSEDYLNMHTKDQIVSLAKEFGLDKHLESMGNDKWDKAKKGDLIKSFLESGFDLKGKVPKLLEKTR